MALRRLIPVIAVIWFLLFGPRPTKSQISVSSQSFDYITGPVQISSGESLDIFIINNGPTSQNARIVIFNVPFVQPMSQTQVLDSDIQSVTQGGFLGRSYQVPSNGIYNVRINIDSRALVPVVNVKSIGSLPRLTLTGGMMVSFIRGVVQY